MPLQATADLGLMPDLVSPVINANSVFIRAHARMFWAYGFNGAINEECSVDEAYLTDPAQPAVQSPVTVEPNGSFPDVQVPSTTIGVIPQLSVVDGGGNTVTVDLDPLPDNTGPPTIRTSHVTTSTSDGSYIIISRGECDLDGELHGRPREPRMIGSLQRDSKTGRLPVSGLGTHAPRGRGRRYWPGRRLAH